MDKNELKKSRGWHLEHWHIISTGLAVYDALAIFLSYFVGLWLRYDCRLSMIPEVYLQEYLQFIPIYILTTLLVFYRLRLYNSIWRFASFNELLRVTCASLLTFVFHCVAMSAFFYRMPVLYYFIGGLLQFLLTLGIRFSYRFVLLERHRLNQTEAAGRVNRVMLIGAGSAGQIILRDIRRTKSSEDLVCCIIDDNRNKWGRYIDGVLVEGGRDEIMHCVKKYHIDKIIVAMPSASNANKRDILNICNETGCELKNLPGVYQLVSGQVSVSALRNVAVEDLLGRDQIKVNMDEIYCFLRDKTVLITGGGGSIGSELARQVAAHGPKQLILFDIYENNVYEIQQELRDHYPFLNLVVLIGSVRDSRRVNQVFQKYRPDVVYHAAAHKHVPLMEESPCEAIKNNAIGTYKTAYAAALHGCERFVLISTDKAVNPTNIMGASKRICEMIIQTFDRVIKAGTPEKLPLLFAHSDEDVPTPEEMRKRYPPEEVHTEFVAVRFGNVLGSNGSVIPLFKKQIAAGGPVTVTHPDIIRYFMTIPEAVSLVLQAGVYAHGGEIFVFDMGEPVKIDTLARNLIKLSGYKPDVDIRIEYTGLRPGEKLYEEKLMREEGMRRTPNDLIHIGAPIPFDEELFLRQLTELMDAANENDESVRSRVEQIVPTYHPSNI